MATAPEPGIGRKKEERVTREKAAQSVITIAYGEDSLSLAWLNVPIGEQLVVRKATGLPLTAFTMPLADAETGPGVIGEDSLLVLWWLARRAKGESQLTFSSAVDEWDRDLLGEVEITTADDEKLSDDPES